MVMVRYRKDKVKPYTVGRVLPVLLVSNRDAEASFPVIYGTTKQGLQQLCNIGVSPAEDTKLRGQTMVRFIGFGYIRKNRVWYPPSSHPECDVFIVLDLERWLAERHPTLLTQECIVETPHWISPIFFLSIFIGSDHNPCKKFTW